MNQGVRPTEKEPAGALISIIIIVLVIIAGAYFFLKRVPTQESASVTPQTETDATTAALSTQGTSDEVADIQKDLDATPDISNVGAGLGDTQL